MPRKAPDNPVLATNKKAFHNYHIIERLEAGIQLVGTEVKSCRDHSVVITEGYVVIEKGEAWLLNVHIATYSYGNRFNHEEKQKRRLLLHRNEILKLAQRLGQKGGTIVPLRFYLKKGLVKVEIAYCQGKNQGDKRETLRRNEVDLEMRRATKR